MNLIRPLLALLGALFCCLVRATCTAVRRCRHRTGDLLRRVLPVRRPVRVTFARPVRVAIALLLLASAICIRGPTVAQAGYNGTVVGSPTFSAAKWSNGVTLNGSTQYITLPDGGSYEVATGTTWAVTCWINTTDSSAGYHEIVSQGGGSNNWIISVNAGKIRAGVASFTGALAFQGFGDTKTVSDGVWHFVCLYVGATATLYVDGISAGTTTGGSYAIPGATRHTRIGSQWDGTDFFNGQIDEVAFFAGSAVTTAVGTVVPTGAYTGSESGLTVLYHLEADATDSYAPPGQTLAVTSSALLFSPGNWWGDTGRGGSVSRSAWANGAYIKWSWTSAGSVPRSTLNIQQTSGDVATMAVYVDGTYTDNVSIPTTANGYAIPGLSGTGAHTVQVFLSAPATSTARWSQSHGVTVTSVLVESADTPIVATVPTKWVAIYGDSTAEGTDSGVSAASTVTCSFAQMISLALQQLGYGVCMSPCGGNGYLAPGDLSPFDVPALYSITSSTTGTDGTYSDTSSRWNRIVGGASGSNSTGYISLLDSNSHISSYGATGTEPTAVISLMGINEYEKNKLILDTQSSVYHWIGAIRGAAPLAYAVVVVPPSLYNTTVYTTQGSAPNKTGADYVTAIKAGYTSYTSANPGDNSVRLIDLGAAVGNTLASAYYNSADGAKVHFTIAGHQYLASQLIPQIVSVLTSTPVNLGGRIKRGR